MSDQVQQDAQQVVDQDPGAKAHSARSTRTSTGVESNDAQGDSGDDRVASEHCSAFGKQVFSVCVHTECSDLNAV